MEGPEATTRVIEDPIEDDPHAAPVALVQQFAQRLVSAQQRIDLEIVVRVVAVVRRGREDRIEVQRRNAETAR